MVENRTAWRMGIAAAGVTAKAASTAAAASASTAFQWSMLTLSDHH